MIFSDIVNNTENIFDVLNNSLQEVTLAALLINLITFFCSLKIGILSLSSSPPPTKYAILQLRIVCRVHLILIGLAADRDR
jgi:hypothetical protein